MSRSKKITLITCGAILHVIIGIFLCFGIPYFIFSNAFHHYDSDADVTIESCLDGQFYDFGKGIELLNTYEEGCEDTLILSNGMYSETLLSGTFTRFTYTERYILVQMQDKYYVFDRESYTKPEPYTIKVDEYMFTNEPIYKENCDYEYDLKEYTASEFYKKYPDIDKYWQ